MCLVTAAIGSAVKGNAGLLLQTVEALLFGALAVPLGAGTGGLFQGAGTLGPGPVLALLLVAWPVLADGCRTIALGRPLPVRPRLRLGAGLLTVRAVARLCLALQAFGTGE